MSSNRPEQRSWREESSIIASTIADAHGDAREQPRLAGAQARYVHHIELLEHNLRRIHEMPTKGPGQAPARRYRRAGSRQQTPETVNPNGGPRKPAKSPASPLNIVSTLRLALALLACPSTRARLTPGVPVAGAGRRNRKRAASCIAEAALQSHLRPHAAAESRGLAADRCDAAWNSLEIDTRPNRY